MKTVDDMIEDILKHEGGFVNHPNDKGGATNWGITIATYSDYIQHKASVQDVKDMSRMVAKQIYRKNYYYAPKIDKLPALIQPVLFDISINSGGSRAIKMLQQVLTDKGYPVGTIDGIVGANTIKYANEFVTAQGGNVVNKICDQRAKFFKNLVEKDPTQHVFLKGWLARAESYKVAVV